MIFVNFVAPETKLKSTLISGCFFAYGLGCIVINVLTLFIRSANALSLFALIIICFTITPSFFSFVESPKWLQKQGRVTDLVNALVYIGKRNGNPLTEKEIFEPLFKGGEGYEFIKDRRVVISIEQKNKAKTNALTNLKEIFTNFM